MVRLISIAAALAGVLATGIGCDDGSRVTASSLGTAPPPLVAARPLPPLTGGAILYAFSAARENLAARGRYERQHGQIHVYFNERSAGADAIGTLRGNLMEVRDSEILPHSDFENAVYVIRE